MNVPVIEPEVEPTTRGIAIDPTTEPWAWKSLLATLALKASTVDIGVGEGDGDGVGEAVGVGEGVGVGIRNGSQGRLQAATDPNRKTTAVPRARRRMNENEGMSRLLAAPDSRAATRRFWGRCLTGAAFSMTASYPSGGPTGESSRHVTSSARMRLGVQNPPGLG
jgi:hypothetical protein